MAGEWFAPQVVFVEPLLANSTGRGHAPSLEMVLALEANPGPD